MLIRRAEVADAALLAQLRVQMRRERETAAPPRDAAAFLAANVEYFRTALAEGAYLGVIAEESGRAAGIAGLCPHRHPPAYATPNGRIACLLNVYTVPEFRRRGVAEALVRELLAVAGRAGYEKVELNASAAGRDLYVRLGFRDAVNAMELELPPAP